MLSLYHTCQEGANGLFGCIPNLSGNMPENEVAYRMPDGFGFPGFDGLNLKVRKKNRPGK